MTAWLASLGSIPLSITMVAALLLSAFVLGGFVTGKAPRARDFELREVLLALTVGLDLAALFVLLLGHCGALSPLSARLTLLAGGAAGVWRIASLARRQTDRISTASQKFILVVFAVFGAVTLGPALCYPGGWDELTYHVELPYRWSAAGTPLVLPDNTYSGFACMPEMLYWLGVSAGGITTPRLIVWLVSLMVFATLHQLLRNSLGPKASIIPAFAFSAGPIALTTGAETYAEPFLLLNLAAALLILHPQDEKDKTLTIKEITTLGVMAGAAAAVKLTGLFVGATIIVLAISHFWLHCQSHERKSFLARVGGVATVCVLFALPFYARPFLATGNPFHPFFAGCFTQAQQALLVSSYHADIGSVKYGLSGLTGLVASPLLLSIPLPSLITVFDGSFGWQLAPASILAALALTTSLRGHDARNAVYPLMAALLYLLWFLSSRQARFLLPAVMLVFFSIQFSINNLPMAIRRLSLLVLLVGTACSFSVPQLKHYLNSWKAAIGAVRLEDYLYTATGEGYLAAVNIVHDQTEKDSTILLVFENRGLYIPRRHLIGTPFFQGLLFTPPENVVDAGHALALLRKFGVNYVLVGLPQKDPDRLPSYVARWTGLAETFGHMASKGWLIPVWSGDDYALYRVKGDGGG